MNIAAILSLLTAAAPGVVAIVKDIQTLAASTGLTTDQVTAAVAALASTTQATDAKTLALIAADQATAPAAHPATPVVEVQAHA